MYLQFEDEIKVCITDARVFFSFSKLPVYT
jgi:hypothetical protein